MRDLSHVKATGRQPGTPQHSLEVETGLNGSASALSRSG